MRYFSLWLLGLLLSTFTAFPQLQSGTNKVAEETVKITASSATVREWLALVERTGVVLAYNPSLINLEERRWIPLGRIRVGELLRRVLADYPLEILPAEGRKLILRIERRKKPISLPVTGFIREKDSAERLYGAVLTFSGVGGGRDVYTLSNDDGAFNVVLPTGDYRLRVTYLGYEAYEGTFHVGNSPVRLMPQLTPLSFELAELTVQPRGSVDELNEVSPSHFLALSSADLFAQIRVLPGVVGAGVNGEFLVNGGGSDENLLLLDGVPVYHANHINSMLPAFNGDAVKSIAFHKEFFPTRFEGRLSSVTDIRMKEGNKTRHSQTFSLDMPAAGVVLEGPIVKNKLSYMLSARRSWLDFFDGLLSEDDRLNHSFVDVNMKLAYDVKPNTSLQASVYGASDNYYASGEKESRHSVLHWTNRLYALKLNTRLSPQLTYSAILSHTGYTNSAYAEALGFEQKKNVESGVQTTSLTSEFTYSVDNAYTASWGVKWLRENYRLALLGEAWPDGTEGGVVESDSVTGKREPVTQLSVFYDNSIRITSRLYAQVGVNFIAYLPHLSKNYSSIQPRFSLKYTIGEKDLLFAGFSRMEQFYHYLRLDALPLPTDFRMPSIEGFRPRTSDHLELGWKHYLSGGMLELSAYAKSRGSVLALRPEPLSVGTHWGRYIMPGKGKSYGLKAYCYYDGPQWTAQLSYSWSRSLERFSELYQRGWVPSLYDVPHVLNGAFTYKLLHGSSVSVGGLLQSGRMMDMDDTAEVLSLDQFRYHRRSMNFRVDAGYTYQHEFAPQGIKMLLRVGLYNIVGNPPQEDFIDFFSTSFRRHCMPFGAITVKF